MFLGDEHLNYGCHTWGELESSDSDSFVQRSVAHEILVESGVLMYQFDIRAYALQVRASFARSGPC
jgi:hypothetical protein